MTKRLLRLGAMAFSLGIGTATCFAGKGHLYTWHQGDYYAYELVQNETDRQHGIAPPSITYAFHGVNKDGVYLLTQINGRFLDRVTCKAPCEIVTITGFDRVTIPLRRGTALWAAVQDMLAGNLKVAPNAL